MSLEGLEFISDKHLFFLSFDPKLLCPPEGGLQSDQCWVSWEAASLFLFTLRGNLHTATV